MGAIVRSGGLKRKRRDYELQFLAPALETLETPAGPLPWATAWLLMIIAICAIAWSSLSSVDVLAIAQGRVIPSGKSKPVQSLAGGKVEAFFVRDGDVVHAGDLLVVLDATESQIELERSRLELLSYESDVTRIDAALKLEPSDLAKFIEGPGAIGLIPEHHGLLFSLVNQQAAKLRRLQAQKSETVANVDATNEQIERLTAILPLIMGRISSISELVDRKIIALPVLLELQQKRIETESDIRLQNNKLIQLGFSISQIEEQAQEVFSDYRKTLLTELNQVRGQMRGINQSIATLNRRISESRIVAPVDGVVYQSLINSVGVVAQPAQAMMQIVPAQETLIIEALLESKDVGFVVVGQDAEVKIDAYPFTQYGTIKGRVLEVSADSSAMSAAPSEQSSGGRSPQDDIARRQVYSVRVEIGSAHGQFLNGAPYELKPGMTSSVDIRTGDRKLIQYIFSPLQTKVSNAARER